MRGFAAAISSRSSLSPCWARASAYAFDIAIVSRNIPPCAAVITISPAAGGPWSTTFHSSGEKAAFVVMAGSCARRAADQVKNLAAPRHAPHLARVNRRSHGQAPAQWLAARTYLPWAEKGDRAGR